MDDELKDNEAAEELEGASENDFPMVLAIFWIAD
jgi:hypothetical protein